MYADIYGHCPSCNRIHWRDRGCSSESKPFWSWDKEAEANANTELKPRIAQLEEVTSEKKREGGDAR